MNAPRRSPPKRLSRAACMLAMSLLAAALGPRLATAQEQSAITWQAPSCPPRWKLESRIEQLLGRRLDPTQTPPLDVFIETTPPSGFSLRLRVGTGEDQKERRLEGADCDQLVDAAALAIALLLNPDLDVPDEGLPPPPEPEPSFSATFDGKSAQHEPTDTKPEPPATRPEPTVEPPSTISWRLGAGAVLDVHALGGPTPGVSTELQLRWQERLSAGLSLVGLPHHRIEGEVNGRFLLGGVGVRFCDHAVRDWLVLAVCAGMEAGFVRGRAQGSDSGGVGRWLAPLGGVRGGVRLRRVELLGTGEAMFPLVREEFFSGPTRVHQLPAVSGRFGFVASVAFH